jgi:uncharacterized repeat protein (TIGR02543 family)
MKIRIPAAYLSGYKTRTGVGIMKTKMFLAGILGLALVFGMVLAGCEDGTTPAKTYTVSFDAGEGTGTPPADRTVEEGKEIYLPGKGDLTAPSGKEFDGWKGDGKTWAIGDSYTVTRSILFIAQWKTPAPGPSTSYTVTFDADWGSSVPEAKTVQSGQTVDALPDDPQRVGFEFGGWYTERNGGGTRFTVSIAVTADITVYAKWTAASYTVTFNADGGSPIPQPMTVQSGQSVNSLPTNPQKTNFDFGGWYTAQNGGGSPFTGNTTVTGNITVYAKWTLKSLVGAWVDNLEHPTKLEIFADGIHYSVRQHQVISEFDYNPNNDPPNLRLSVYGAASYYEFELSDDTLTLTLKQYQRVGADRTDVTFKRILSSTKPGVYGAWVTSLLADNNANTLLVIQPNNNVFTSFDLNGTTYNNTGSEKNREDGNYSVWQYQSSNVAGDLAFIIWPDSPAVPNSYTIANEQLKVTWKSRILDDNESFDQERTYTKLEL